VERVDPALVHGVWAVFSLLVAVLGTLLLGSPAAGPLLRGTGFETGLWHYLAVGGVLTALMAGLYHWWPALTGRTVGGARGLWGAVLTGLGVNTAFLPRLVTGVRGVPSRLHELPPSAAGVAPWLAIGAALLVAGLTVVAVDLLTSLRRPPAGTE